MQNARCKFSIILKGHEPYEQMLHGVCTRFDTLPLRLCNVSHKSRLVLNVKFCEDDVLGCSCSDYYFNCADVCELLFIKTVILARLLDCRQLITVIKIMTRTTICMQAWPHALQSYDRIVSTCMQLTQF